ncbi:MAG: hypothetical protein SLAVMIC_00512 [uncultured marine phage]|uniref:DUF6576 domain-containing protein n=1 Tax=uncultured marine phage TaxID=707152 RepID=A0A8D9CC83_9VIRU|nr:MAG: hypothetical protein SLAVMIC_00512 [uncultured marine phage]
MKKIKSYKLFLESRIDNYTDELLDKISKHGVKSLSDEERKFLDSHKSGTQEETLDKIQNEFSDEFGGIKVTFKYTGSKKIDNNYYQHNGIMVINGVELEGDMAEYHGGFMTDFEDEEYNDWSLMSGQEYEYEQFLELIFGELDANPRLV